MTRGDKTERGREALGLTRRPIFLSQGQEASAITSMFAIKVNKSQADKWIYLIYWVKQWLEGADGTQHKFIYFSYYGHIFEMH